MDIELERRPRREAGAAHRQQLALDRALGNIGTTLVQWDAMRAIAADPGASAHRLALATFQTDQAFGKLANRLEAQHLIERGPGEGRRIAHRLSRRGRQMLADANVVAERVRNELYVDLSAADRQTLAALLERVLADDKAADLVLPGQKQRARLKTAPPL